MHEKEDGDKSTRKVVGTNSSVDRTSHRDIGVTIKNLTLHTIPSRSVFSSIAEKILPRWEISLVFVGPQKARELNRQLRNKEYVPNVLSYTVGEKSAEVIICPNEASKQASGFSLSSKSFLLLLFIHGVLHIKGWAHGVTMEQCERKLLTAFYPRSTKNKKSVVRPFDNGTTHCNRH